MYEDGLSTINADGFRKVNRKAVGVLKASGVNTIKVDDRPFLIEIKAHEIRKLVWLIRELSVWKPDKLVGGHRHPILYETGFPLRTTRKDVLHL